MELSHFTFPRIDVPNSAEPKRRDVQMRGRSLQWSQGMNLLDRGHAYCEA